MLRRGSLCAAVLCVLLCLCACAQPSCSRTVYAMDTVMTLTAYGKDADGALAAAEAELHRLDALLDRHSGSSAVASLDRDGQVSSRELADLLIRAKALSSLTDGAFELTLAPVIEAWGFGTDAPRVPEDAELSALLPAVGADRISIDGEQIALAPGTQIDLGGIAKGHAADAVCALLVQQGISSAVIDLGGDVGVLGTKPDGTPWRIAVKDPADGSQHIGVLSAADTFVVTSGIYERFFEQDGVRYHHIIDPATGRSAQSGLVSATVICADGTDADALSTAVFVMGAERAHALYETVGSFEMILVTDDGRVLYTKGLADSFEPNRESGYAYEELA